MNLENVKLRSDHPYPKIVGAEDCKMTVGILKNLATARSGELSGILQNIYQSVIADKTMEDVAKVFEEIGIVEMVHLSLLMHAITDFGGVPMYEDREGQIFNTSAINYNMKLRDMLDMNINAERLSIEQYRMAINRVKNDSLKELFIRIIEDEECHLEAFKYIRDNVEFLSI